MNTIHSGAPFRRAAPPASQRTLHMVFTSDEDTGEVIALRYPYYLSIKDAQAQAELLVSQETKYKRAWAVTVVFEL